jgi:hypothetical protein
MTKRIMAIKFLKTAQISAAAAAAASGRPPSATDLTVCDYTRQTGQVAFLTITSTYNSNRFLFTNRIVYETNLQHLRHKGNDLDEGFGRSKSFLFRNQSSEFGTSVD